MKRLQRCTQNLQILNAELLSALLRWHFEHQMPVGIAALAHLRSKVDRERANDAVTRLHLDRVEVGQVWVKSGAVLLHPVQRAGVAGDEKSSYAVILS